MRRKEFRSRGTASTAVMEPGDAPSASLSQKEIAALAYSYWEARGCQGGSSEEDWLRAESEMRDRQSQRSVSAEHSPRTMKQTG
jgi:hypothetical protein